MPDMPRTFSITTAIDYTNGAPHIGHAYEKVLTDAIARHRRLRGEPVFFLTGVDQHGQKVQQSAQKLGLEPKAFVDGISAQFLALWSKLGISHDAWAATTEPVHIRCVQGMLQRLWDSGHFYKDKRGGHYSVRQEQFLTEKERGPDGEFGPEWGEVVYIEEENYYFKLAGHRDWLLGLFDSRWVELPEGVRELSGGLPTGFAGGGTAADAQAFVGELYKRTPVLDTGARAATATFSQKGIGDVHLTFESEAHLEVAEAGGELEIIYPKKSIRVDPPIAVVDKNVDKKGTRHAAEAYLGFLYSPEGRSIIARHHYRPWGDDPPTPAAGEAWPAVDTFTIDAVGGWPTATKKFFGEGGVFDAIYTKAGR